jgi:hypothetical protein
MYLATSTTNTVLGVFGIMAVGCVVVFFVIWVNWLVVKRDKRHLARWLAAKGCRVQKMEWVLYPAGGRFWVQRCTTLEIRFTDDAGLHHHAFAAVPTFGEPILFEDTTVSV